MSVETDAIRMFFIGEGWKFVSEGGYQHDSFYIHNHDDECVIWIAIDKGTIWADEKSLYKNRPHNSEEFELSDPKCFDELRSYLVKVSRNYRKV